MAMTKVPQPCVCTSIRRVSRALARSYDDALAPAGLNVTQMAVLRAVQRHDDAPLTRIADDLCMDRTSLYRALRPLHRDGWLEIQDGIDARSRQARITAVGKRVLDAADPRWSAMQQAIVRRFGTKAWGELVEEIGRLSSCIPQVAVHQ